MRKTLTVSLLCLALLLPFPAFTQSSVDAELNAKIRKEGMENSQILRTLHFLADVYGPRLTGSPNHKNAAEWTIKQMAAWGFQNGHLEPWDLGHPGWLGSLQWTPPIVVQLQWRRAHRHLSHWRA